MFNDIRTFFAALACLKTSRHFKSALWTIVGSMVFMAASQTTAYGLEFPMTTSLTLPTSKNLTASGNRCHRLLSLVRPPRWRSLHI
jgi:hypothetical protein